MVTRKNNTHESGKKQRKFNGGGCFPLFGGQMVTPVMVTPVMVTPVMVTPVMVTLVTLD